MNKALLFAVILGLCAIRSNGLAISTSPVVCTEENDNTMHPDLTDCTRFYHCTMGTAYRKSCYIGLVFNPRESVCDYPSGVPECGGVTPAPEKPQPTTSGPGPTAAPPSITSGPEPTGAPPATTAAPPKTTTKVTTVVPPPPGDLTCPADSDLVYYPIAGTCSRFYLCRDGAYVGSYSCQEGLNFSPARQACLRPEKYSC